MSISVIIPSIRPTSIDSIFSKLILSYNSTDIEIIVVGPVNPNNTDVLYIEEFGSPSRALQRASIYATKDKIMWMCDDVEDMPMYTIMNNINKISVDTDIINWIHSEGPAYITNQDTRCRPPYEWFNAHFHDDLRSPGVDTTWKIAPFFMMNRTYWNWLGGIDCDFETINMNLHDLLFRAQKNNSNIILSDGCLFHAAWQNAKENNRENECPIYKAFFDNDLPLFKQLYSDNSRAIQIDIDNWKKQPSIWERRNYE